MDYKEKYLFCKREYFAAKKEQLVEYDKGALTIYNFLITTTKTDLSSLYIYDFHNDHNRTTLADIMSNDDNININLKFKIGDLHLVNTDFSSYRNNHYDYIIGMNIGDINVRLTNILNNNLPALKNIDEIFIYFKNIYDKLKVGGEFIFYARPTIIPLYTKIFEHIESLSENQLFSSILEKKENFINDEYRIEGLNIFAHAHYKNRSNFAIQKKSESEFVWKSKNSYNILMACHTSQFQSEKTDDNNNTYLGDKNPIYIEKDNNIGTRTEILDIYNQNSSKIKFNYDFTINRLNYVEISEDQKYDENLDYYGWDNVPYLVYDFIISVYCSPIIETIFEYESIEQGKLFNMNNQGYNFIKLVYNRLAVGGQFIFVARNPKQYIALNQNFEINGNLLFKLEKLDNANFFHGKYKIMTSNGLDVLDQVFSNPIDLYSLKRLSDVQWI